jgi:hypothetical protein
MKRWSPSFALHDHDIDSDPYQRTKFLISSLRSELGIWFFLIPRKPRRGFGSVGFHLREKELIMPVRICPDCHGFISGLGADEDEPYFFIGCLDCQWEERCSGDAQMDEYIRYDEFRVGIDIGRL